MPPTQTPNTDSPTAPPTPPNPPPPGPPENPEQPTTPLRAFIKGCGEGAAIVADSAIPFVDPFEAAGFYSDETPGADISRVLADISMGLLSVAGSIRGLADLTYRAPRGSLLYRINNNQYARIGYSMWPRTQGRVPRISIPTFKFRQWEFEGRHWDLRVCGR